MDDNIKYEKDILATFLIDADSHIYIKRLTEDDFTDVKNKAIFSKIKELYVSNELINAITVRDKFKSTDKNQQSKILEYLISLTDELITTSNINYNINRLSEIRLKNSISKILVDINNDINEGEKDIQQIKNELILKIKDIKDVRNISVGQDIKEILYQTLEDIESKSQSKEDYSYFTGLFKLDDLTDGLHECELTCIGARPGVGKTAFALNIAENIAKKGKKVYFCCLEMSPEQIMQRIISSYTEINTQIIRTGRLSPENMIKIGEATNKILELKLRIDTDTRYIEDLDNKVTILKDKDEIDLLIIDYLTLLKSKNRFASRELEVAEISRKLKLMALDLKIPIIVLVQLNREAENKIPTMATIRESGSIEQNCDNIIFIHAENEEIVKNKTEVTVILAKQRQGTRGEFKVDFDKRYSKFINKIY